MSSTSFIPVSDAGKVVWIKNFALKLPLYAAKYHIQPDEVSDMQASSLYFAYSVEYARQIEECKTNINAYKGELRDGKNQFGTTLPLPLLPNFDTPPPAVSNGIFKRVSAIAQRIKNNTQYVESDGRDLGIIAEHSVFDPQKAKPAFSIGLIDGGHPEIAWVKGKMDGVEIYVSRDNSDEFTFLAYDQRPNYTDTYPLPSAGKAAVWRYRLIYRYKDKQSGFWSDTVSISVSGN